MDIESISLTLPISESPGLETIDPRMDEISTLVQDGDFPAAAAQVEALFAEEIYDVRLIGYFLYGVFLDGGMSALEGIFDRLAHTLTENWDALGPPADKRVKGAQTGLGWLFKQLLRNMERAESTRNDAFETWIGQVNSDDVQQILDRGDDLSAVFTDVLEDEGVPLRDSLSKLLEWLRSFKSVVPAPPSEEEDEPEDEIEEPEEEEEEEHEPRSAVADGSPQLALLLKKLEAFSRLAAKGEIYRAAIIAADVNHIMGAFDPRVYFPEMFVDFLKVSVERAGQLEELERLRGSPQWQAAERFYQVDLDAFVKTPLPVPAEWSGATRSDTGIDTGSDSYDDEDAGDDTDDDYDDDGF